LVFDVLEETEEDQLKLMSIYSSKYFAQRLGNSTTMMIEPNGGEKLMDQYLNQSL
jgi:hypothetical protein